MRLPVMVIWLLLLNFSLVKAQVKKLVRADSLFATINVLMTNSKKLAQKGEQVIFTGTSSKAVYIVTTGAKGAATLQLPPGDSYTIRLKTMQDTTEYSSMEIPALKKGQFFKDAFTVTIEYDPPVSFSLDNVEFDLNKATLRPGSYKQLDELAEYLKWKEDDNVEIAGHTDNVGTAADNRRLSQQRAETVKAYLVKKGIALARITAKGYGDTQPVADNSSAQGRQKNRRTEARLLAR